MESTLSTYSLTQRLTSVGLGKVSFQGVPQMDERNNGGPSWLLIHLQWHCQRCPRGVGVLVLFLFFLGKLLVNTSEEQRMSYYPLT